MSLAYFQRLFNEYLNEESDYRTVDWFPVKNPWQLHLITLLYFYVVLISGPKYMENRKPYDLKKFISIFNIFQIISNAYVIYAFMKNGMLTEFSPICPRLDKSPDGKPYEISVILYYTTLIKFIDLIETLLFILRKKNNQVSFLHVFHHSSILYICYLTLKYYPGAPFTYPTALNSLVHVVMYSYYLMSSYPSFSPITNLIKRYITIIQLVQFFILGAYLSQFLFASCPVSEWFGAYMMFMAFMNIVLFTNFYVQNYLKKSNLKSH